MKSARRQSGRRLLAAIVLALSLAGSEQAATATAGDFPVRQCRGSDHEGFFGAYGTPSTVDRVDVLNGCVPGGVSKIGVYQDRSGVSIPFGAGGQFIWAPGTGVRIVGTSINAKLREANGMRPSVSGTHLATGSIDLDGQEPLDGELRTTEWSSSGEFVDLVVARLICIRETGCANTSSVVKAYFEIFDLEMTARDFMAPSVELSGGLGDQLGSGGWTRGLIGYSATASDWGSGLSRLTLEANGFEVRLPADSCPGDRGGYATSFTPCARSVSHLGQVDTSAAPFREGQNTVRVCAADFAVPLESANRTCTEAGSLLVDNSAPAPPVDLEVTGGSAWRADNGFDFTWRLPGDGGSPITGAEYRVFALSGGPELARGNVTAASPLSAGPIQVPGTGAYRIEFRLVDGAGNVGLPASSVVRFDDAPPGNVDPEAPSGWVSADELPFRQPVAIAAAGGPSGVTGYAVAASQEGPVRPCSGRVCLQAELTTTGGVEDSTATLPNLAEGTHWISAVAASGARMPSRIAGSTVVRVDRSDPVTVITGVPDGWVNRPVTLVARASDEMSGMEPKPSDEGEPVTVIAPEGQAPYEATGDEARFTVASEGVTRVRYWAEDLAGNANDGQVGPNGNRHAPPGSTFIRIDTTAPNVAFRPQDPADPEIVTATATDSSSGVDHGRIGIRKLGGDAFTWLRTSLSAGELVARIPSDDLPAGAYELRAEATDRAGNPGATALTEDGGAKVLTLPLKKAVSLTLERDRARSKVVTLVGTIRHVGGPAMSGASLVVEQSFAAGSRNTVLATPATSDGAGRFRLTLPAGPNRSVRVLFPGTKLDARASSPVVRAWFRDRISFGLGPARLRNGGRVQMRGTVRGSGAILPAGGKLVAIQFFDPSRSRWRPVEVLRTNRAGRFRFSYRFRTITSAQRIRFRAVSLPEAGWPYRSSTSASRSVIVYPAGS